VLTDVGEVWMWGGGEKGQLGTGEDLNYSLPVLVDALQAKQSTAQQSKAVKPYYSKPRATVDRRACRRPAESSSL
jgi:hypothetical protein